MQACVLATFAGSWSNCFLGKETVILHKTKQCERKGNGEESNTTGFVFFVLFHTFIFSFFATMRKTDKYIYVLTQSHATICIFQCYLRKRRALQSKQPTATTVFHIVGCWPHLSLYRSISYCTSASESNKLFLAPLSSGAAIIMLDGPAPPPSHHMVCASNNMPTVPLPSFWFGWQAHCLLQITPSQAGIQQVVPLSVTACFAWWAQLSFNFCLYLGGHTEFCVLMAGSDVRGLMHAIQAWSILWLILFVHNQQEQQLACFLIIICISYMDNKNATIIIIGSMLPSCSGHKINYNKKRSQQTKDGPFLLWVGCVDTSHSIPVCSVCHILSYLGQMPSIFLGTYYYIVHVSQPSTLYTHTTLFRRHICSFIMPSSLGEREVQWIPITDSMMGSINPSHMHTKKAEDTDTRTSTPLRYGTVHLLHHHKKTEGLFS